MDNQKISVIIPAYQIEPDISIVKDALDGLDYEIIVQYDYYGEGKGITLQRGFKQAVGGIIVWLDADMQIHPQHIHSLLEKYYSNPSIVAVIGSKFHPFSVVNCSFPRKILSYFGYKFIKFLFRLPIQDTQTGIKLFHRKVLEGNWKIRGFGYDIEVLYKANKMGEIGEIPVRIEKSYQSTVNFKTCFNTLKEALKIRISL